jgi:hypothetical protein
MRLRGLPAAALAALLALGPMLVRPVLAGTATGGWAGVTADAVTTYPKVVIVVGATETTTASYRSDADTIATEALKYTPNVIKIYSPNATYALVKAAAQGASVFIYLGHGYGYPSPYRPVLSESVQDGMGLNTTAGVSDSDKTYYGASLIAADFRFAKNAVVILNHLCYSAGSSETGNPEPTIPVARERVDNFASGWIKAGARAVLADSWTSGVVYDIRSIFTTDQTIGNMWNHAPNNQGHEQPFVPQRNPQFTGVLDPDTMTTGFHRSIVAAMDMKTTDIVAGAGAAPTSASTGSTDTTAPSLWSVDGPTTITPNNDGAADRVNLLARWSEPVNWAAEIRDAANNVVRTQTGSGFQGAVTWDARVSGAFAPAGDYTYTLHATDLAGNVGGDGTGTITIADQPTPDTGVLSFVNTTPLTTTTPTVVFALTFSGPVTGLDPTDLTRVGSAPNCVIGPPVGSGAAYTITITGCSTGTVGLYLNAGTVTDTALNVGPAGPISTPRVTIDVTAPKATAPTPSLRTGLPLEGTSTSQRLLIKISWTGSDSGAGIANYDVARSYDGAAYQTIASATTATALNWTMTPGHSYRFRVRARDKAGNVGSWMYASTWYSSLVQESSSTVTYTGTWATTSDSQASGGSIKSSSGTGATATMAFSGRAVSWVTTLRPTNGAAQVFIDGVLAATTDTVGSTTTPRQIVFSKAWSSYGSHTIRIVVVGTSGRPQVDLDAFEVMR